MDALDEREWRRKSEDVHRLRIVSQESMKQESEKNLFVIVLLFFAGIITGIGVMIALGV